MRSFNALPYHFMCWLSARPKTTAAIIVALVVAVHVMEQPA